MACHFLTNHDLTNFGEDSNCRKALCSVADLVLYPVTSLVIGIASLALLLIKTLYKGLTFILASIKSCCCREESPQASSWFSCISSLAEDPCYYAAPLLLVPVVGAIFYAIFVAKTFIRNEGEKVSCLDAVVVACQAPWALLHQVSTTW